MLIHLPSLSVLATVYKVQSRKPTGDVRESTASKEIHDSFNTHLVMHGSSSVPQKNGYRSSKYGGEERHFSLV